MIKDLGENKVASSTTSTSQHIEPEIVDSGLLDSYEEARRTLLSSNRATPLLDLKVQSEKRIALELVDSETIWTALQKPSLVNLISNIAPQNLDNQLQTGLAPLELQKRLNDMYATSRLAMSEKGAQTLYVSFGSVNLKSSDGTSEITAPLMLLPVALKREANGHFTLRGLGQDPEVNVPLQKKLSEEFGIEMPEPGVAEKTSPSRYIEQVQAALANSNVAQGVSITSKSASLGVFSFGNYVLFKDLETKHWEEGKSPVQNQIIKDCLEAGFFDNGPLIDPNANIDHEVEPLRQFEVLGSDSSQLRVLDEIRRGKSLVVEGPPGTGKSATITNLIANAVADGKRVLFVSEKAAALDVVKKQLDAIGIGDICLALYGEHASRQGVVDSLRATTELGRPLDIPREPVVKKLLLNRGRLNDHVDILKGEVRGSGFGGYEVLSQLIGLTDDKQERLDLESPEMRAWARKDYDAAQKFCEELERYYTEIGLPKDHPFYGVGLRKSEVGDSQKLSEQLTKAHETIQELNNALTKIMRGLKLSAAERPESLSESVNVLRSIDEIYSNDGQYFADVDFKDSTWVEQKQELIDIIEAGKRYASIMDRCNNYFKGDAVRSKNIADAISKLDEQGGKNWWGKTFGGGLGATEEYLNKIFIDGKRPEDASTQKALLQQLLEAQKLLPTVRDNAAALSTLFGEAIAPNIKSTEREWERAHVLAKFITGFVAKNQTSPDYAALCRILKSPTDLYALSEDLSALGTKYESFVKARNDLTSTLKLSSEELDNKFLTKSLAEQEKLLKGWRFNAAKLDQILDYNQFVADAAFSGKEFIVSRAEKWPKSPQRLVNSLKYSWFTGLAEDLFAFSPLAGGFQDALHEEYLKGFVEADKRVVQLNALAVATKHWDGIPRLNTGGQFGVLYDEFEKKGGYLPIRQLFEQAGHAVQTIKPVVIASPESVAECLPQTNLNFDLVVFDEASQIKPAEAFGAIARGQQVVVFGDSKQLPPSTFFESSSSLAINNEEGAGDSIENILDLMVAGGAPRRELQWHYRSLRGGLIKISNDEFYDGQLKVFPRAERNGEAVGLTFNKVNGCYLRSTSRNNLEEAEAVAKAVIDHAKKFPEQSLGVVALSRAQMEAITEAVETQRANHPELESFFDEHKPESFFVKNLENVQGDQRDRVIISLGYGPDSNGNFSMNFGPLNTLGGERRLNVLMTRAKDRCDVYASFDPEDLETGKSDAYALKVLKKFLRYARDGKIDEKVSAPDSKLDPLLGSIKRRLEAQGLEVDALVGPKGAKVDLAIVDPKNKNRYALAVTTDGEQYLSMTSARDRDHLMPDALKARGWNLHHVWAIEWFKDPEKEVAKIVAALKRRGDKDSESKVEDFTVKREVLWSEERDSADAAKPYEKAKFKISPAKAERLINSASTGSEVEAWSDLVAKIVEAEGPIHREEVFRRAREALGAARVTESLKEAVAEGERRAGTDKRIAISEDFLTIPGKQIQVRERSRVEGPLKQFNRIAAEEITEAISMVVKNSCGIERADIASETLSLLGYRAAPEGSKERIESLTEQMLRTGMIRNEGKFIILNSM